MPSPSVVNIGMPVYNGENTVAAAIESILCQTYQNFVLIISDNASTDRTSEICQRYADQDRRMHYIRQPNNIGMEENFAFLLEEASSEYFMWNAADDRRSPDFIEVNLSFLQEHEDYLGSTSPSRFSNGGFDEIFMGDAALDDENPYDRINKSLGTGVNGRIYSLFKRKAIINWPYLHDMFFLGADWTLPSHVAAQGKMHRVSQGWVEFGSDGISRSSNFYSRYRSSWLDWLFPFKRLTIVTMKLMKGAPIGMKISILIRLFYLNARKFILQFLPKRLVRMLMSVRLRSV